MSNNMSAHTPEPCPCKVVAVNLPTTWDRAVAIEFCPLHAAAPALLEALERVLDDYTEGCEYNFPKMTCADTPLAKPCSVCQARAAIAAAKGEQS